MVVCGMVVCGMVVCGMVVCVVVVCGMVVCGVVVASFHCYKCSKAPLLTWVAKWEMTGRGVIEERMNEDEEIMEHPRRGIIKRLYRLPRWS